MKMSWSFVGCCALLLSATIARADCCSAPVVSAGTPQEIEALRRKIDEILGKMGNMDGSGGGLAPGGAEGGGGVDPGPPDMGGVDDSGEVTGGGDGTVDPGDTFDAETVAQNLGEGAFGGFTKEPNQNAVLAWNGTEEILVLHTVQESLIGKGTFLQFLPLPGEVLNVREGDKNLFKNVRKLILQKSRLGSGGAGNVVKTFDVGPHHIFVWKINRYENFIKGVNAYIKKRSGGKAIPLITKKMEGVLRDYFKRGFRYFAFDLVNITPNSTKIDALEYHFKSNHLFYPVGITMGGATGDTRIELAVLTKAPGVNRFFGPLKYKEHILNWGKTVPLTPQELGRLGKSGSRISQLFGNNECIGRMWVLRGAISDLAGDVQADLRP